MSSSEPTPEAGEPGGGEAQGPGPQLPEPQPPQPRWRLPAGGTAVERVPEDSSLQKVDAFGNLWLNSCSGLFLVHEGGIQRYRYLDTPWVRGRVSVTADEQGHIWLESDGRLSQLEAGDVREVPIPQGAPLLELAFGSDGVAWALTFDESRSTQSGWYQFQAFHPERAPAISAPRWARLPVAGRDGALWVGADEEIYRFAEGRFWGPYAFEGSAPSYFYDPQDDTLVVSGGNTFTRLAFDGETVVMVEQRDVPWTFAFGRLSDGRLVATDYSTADDGAYQSRLLVLDGEQDVGTPIAEGDFRSLLGASREIYVQTRRSISRYREGQLEPVLAIERQPRVPQASELRDYGQALRATAQEASGADLQPLVPPLLHQKLHLTGRMYIAGFEAPTTLELDDGAYIRVGIAQQLRLFAEAQGLQLLPPYDDGGARLGAPVEKGEPWDLYGYLDPSSCDNQPDEKVFHLIEAYPVSMPREERLALSAALRTAHPD